MKDIALKLWLSQKTVRRYLHSFYNTGEVEPASQQHVPSQIIGSLGQLEIFRIIFDFPGIYLHEVLNKFAAKFGIRISAATLCRVLKRMGCTRQVIQHVQCNHPRDTLESRFLKLHNLNTKSVQVYCSSCKIVVLTKNTCGGPCKQSIQSFPIATIHFHHVFTTSCSCA